MKPNVLIGFEFSGRVRDAFNAMGCRAASVDFLDSETPGEHYRGDIKTSIVWAIHWDAAIFFPPCTYLASSGARWFTERFYHQVAALETVRWLMGLPIERIAIENPVGVISTRIRKPDQYIQPWQFGHGETKKTCLWLKNLPPLKPTNIVEGRVARVHHEPPGPDRWKNRSRTYQGIAEAMAEQWGSLLLNQSERSA